MISDTAAMIGQAEFILYVASQSAATAFWSQVLNHSPSLDVPGMTEFALGDGALLGLMPEEGIRTLLGAALPDPARARGIPRSELYLLVDDPAAYHSRALAAGARELSPLTRRSWGDWVAYSLDPEGHVVAFASRSHAAEN
jgi:predicted enzyme related to lactoylglutathione lyase